jgi:ubiquinone/menaquinone biosynthesis C-methylase UbiE|tara:strand:- start:1906 stop:2517 length:612 start_codon:yes stop_codon:yes gene_type:complete
MYNEYSGFFKSQRDKYFKKILSNHFKNIPLVVDIGCGQGDFLTQAKELRINAEGIDDKEFWVTRCVKKGLKAKKGSIFEIPYDDNSVDGVFLQSVLEHTDPVKSMKEISRVIKNEGIVAISCPTPEKHFWDDPTHVRPYTIKSLSTLFEMFGFKVTHKNYVFAELLGMTVTWNGLFKWLNLIPARIGSNIIVIGKKENISSIS